MSPTAHRVLQGEISWRLSVVDVKGSAGPKSSCRSGLAGGRDELRTQGVLTCWNGIGCGKQATCWYGFGGYRRKAVYDPQGGGLNVPHLGPRQI